MTREQFISHVKCNEKPFRRFLVALCCGDTSLADDIAQESYIKAYLSIGSLDNPEKFRFWMFRIGYNTFISHRRSERKTLSYEEASEALSPSEADNNFRYQSLHLALSRIPARERSVILLFYMEGYSAQEISRITDTSEANVRQQLTRGRRHLKEILEKERQ